MPLPSWPIGHGRPGSGLLAHVLISRNADHWPLYCQCQRFEHEALDLCRATRTVRIGKSTGLQGPPCGCHRPSCSVGQRHFRQ
ncbi:MAG: IS66 family transposase [Alkalilacustris sp.]